MTGGMLRGVLLATCVVAPASARADGWFVAEAPAAVAVSDAQSGVFRPGAMPALGAYADNGWLALGARVRAGVLRNGPSPGHGLEDPGVGGLFTGGLAMRVHKKGGWLELVGGGGLTGTDVVPAFEAGAGWTFPVGDYDVGPSARFVRVVDTDEMSAFGSADLLVFGVDIQFGVSRGRKILPRSERVVVAAPSHRVEAIAVVGPVSDDHDVIAEAREASCAEKFDGCQLSEHAQMFEDRIVLDERVLFEFGRANLRDGGKSMIGEISAAWRAHPEWKHITVEGHTDVRGSDAFNQTLSDERAQQARLELIHQGFAPGAVSAAGFGRSRPMIVDAKREEQHHKNRRVEFVIDRETSVLSSSTASTEVPQ